MEKKQKNKQCYEQFLKKKQSIYLLHFYTSTTSSFSNSPSNSSFKSIFFSKNSSKLDGDLHPTIGSLSQFL